MAGVALMLGLWLGLVGLGTSEQLHQLVHSDSHQVHHECLVTLFYQSLLFHSPDSAAAPLAVFVFLGLLVRAVGAFLPQIDLRLSPCRAPPFVSSLRF